MKEGIGTFNMSDWEGMINVQRSILEHLKDKGTRSQIMYYDLYAKYCQRIKEGVEKGKFIVGIESFVPTEVIYAMDLIPMNLITSSWSMGLTLKKSGEFLKEGEVYGLPWDCCSGHRILIGCILKGDLPPSNVVVTISMGCNNLVKSGFHVMELQNCPGFALDLPSNDGEEEVKYFAEELGDLVSFLEEQSGQKMDWERLKDTMELGRQQVQLLREIGELRKAVPAPMRTRTYMQLYWTNLWRAGEPEVVTYLKAVRDDIKENVEKKRGPAPKERSRLLSFLLPPQHQIKILDWMDKELGAVSVMEPQASHWGEVEIDPAKPLESLARKTLQTTMVRQLHGPMERLIRDAVDDAIAYKADGAIFWGLATCHTSPSFSKSIKDSLREEVGIPTLVVDTDSTDPYYRSEEEVRRQIEGFMEMLDARKSASSDGIG